MNDLAIDPTLSFDPPEPTVQLFGYGPTIDGFEVIALDTGRPVTESFETPQQANGHAQYLNQVARNGSKALAKALRG